MSNQAPRKRQLRLRRCNTALAKKLGVEAGRDNSDPFADTAPYNTAVQQAPSNDLVKENEQLKEQYLRARADLENFRKRSQKDKEQLRKFASEDMVREILPTIDNFDRAITSKKEAKNDKGFAEGVEMIFKQLTSILESRGVEKIHPKGDDFDPQFHEAVSTVPAESPDQNNKVIEVVQPGYVMNGRVLRPAMVCIAKSEG
jgi:molecular chaperone GrpE